MVLSTKICAALGLGLVAIEGVQCIKRGSDDAANKSSSSTGDWCHWLCCNGCFNSTCATPKFTMKVYTMKDGKNSEFEAIKKATDKGPDDFADELKEATEDDNTNQSLLWCCKPGYDYSYLVAAAAQDVAIFGKAGEKKGLLTGDAVATTAATTIAAVEQKVKWGDKDYTLADMKEGDNLTEVLVVVNPEAKAAEAP